MVTYVTLMKLTDKGIAGIKEAPQRVHDAVRLLESMGGKLISFHVVMGEYDYVGVAELPSDEAAAAYVLKLAATGNVRTTGMKAFNLDAFAGIVAKV
jgi:uncharacterized protein with GYD domain